MGEFSIFLTAHCTAREYRENSWLKLAWKIFFPFFISSFLKCHWLNSLLNFSVCVISLYNMCTDWFKIKSIFLLEFPLCVIMREHNRNTLTRAARRNRKCSFINDLPTKRDLTNLTWLPAEKSKSNINWYYLFN